MQVMIEVTKPLAREQTMTKVKYKAKIVAIKELHSFSASSISAINKSLDASLKAFSERSLSDTYPYLILDARYERTREGGSSRTGPCACRWAKRVAQPVLACR